MQRHNRRLLLSASDLANFAECPHRTWLDRTHLDTPMEKAPDDESMLLVQRKGIEHEGAYLARLKAAGRHVVEISDDTIDRKVERTREAIVAGTEVIFQAALRRDDLVGYADFVVRGDLVGATPDTYEVVDTKLARTTKVKFVLQLAFYSDLLSEVTGSLPRHMHIELGDGRRESLRVSDSIHYTRHLTARMTAGLERYPEVEPPYPVPCDHCAICPWRIRCNERRGADDHLSAVANIQRSQIGKLEAGGIRTLAALAHVDKTAKIAKLEPSTLQRLRQQATLQNHERTLGEQLVVVLPTISSQGIRAFARLPRPDDGDLFFDMEGDPHVEGGLDYLFGLVHLDGSRLTYRCFWANDRASERRAFTELLDFVVERIARFPGAHIYHYGAYENAALKRLMTSHGVGEAIVDGLLRGHRLVDLYKVVREGLRISKPGYSLKDVEAFYRDRRDAVVVSAGDSIVAYERWRDTGEEALLEGIRSYNEDDCHSTWQLREWLLSLRPAGLEWFGATTDNTGRTPPRRPTSDNTMRIEAELARMRRRLLDEPDNPAIERHLAELLFALLDFHRREDKPGWWAMFDRQDADEEALLDDSEVVAGLHSPQWAGGDTHPVTRYRYPEQDFKLKAGSRAKRLADLKDVKIVAVDETERTIDLEFPCKDGPPASMDISGGAPIDAAVIQASVCGFVESVIAGDTAHRAVLSYLRRATPAIDNVAPGASLVGSAGPTLPAILDAVRGMNETYLFVQGPPGAGKTFTGAKLIAALLEDGKRVAVSSNSHKAIVNLLESIDRAMHEAGATYEGMYKPSPGERGIDSPFIVNVRDNAAICKAMPQLVAGTAWLLSRPEFALEYDYLFVDEAGQVSIANVVGMGRCARNLVLLGDPMQLAQPIKGCHPGRSGKSALEYLLDGEATIAPDRGIFLERTYRMHPDVCRFVSDAFYDSRLVADDSTHGQALVLDTWAHVALKPTGLSYVGVDHQGCTQRSEEEAAAVRELVDNLLTQRYRDGDGVISPLTLDDILIVAPYNMQVNLLRRVLPAGARVGTVDKFQGLEGQVVVVSMATSADMSTSRSVAFLFSRNRLNVASSRARCLLIMVSACTLANIPTTNPSQLSLLNDFCLLKNQLQ